MTHHNNLTDDMKIANCKICMLAEAMKDCQNCPFNIGLAFKVDTESKYPAHLLAMRRIEFINQIEGVNDNE